MKKMMVLAMTLVIQSVAMAQVSAIGMEVEVNGVQDLRTCPDVTCQVKTGYEIMPNTRVVVLREQNGFVSVVGYEKDVPAALSGWMPKSAIASIVGDGAELLERELTKRAEATDRAINCMPGISTSNKFMSCFTRK